MATDGVYLFVSDTNDNRVLAFPLPLPETQAEGVLVLGQYDFHNAQVLPIREGLSIPRGLSVVVGPFHQTFLWVADSSKDRVVKFSGISRLADGY